MLLHRGKPRICCHAVIAVIAQRLQPLGHDSTKALLSLLSLAVGLDTADKAR